MSAFYDYLKTKQEHWRGTYVEAVLEDCWNAAIKHAEALKPSHNMPQAEICANIIESDDVCCYCEANGDFDNSSPCYGCESHNHFIGRKLSAVR